jgi:hypothetical protein
MNSTIELPLGWDTVGWNPTVSHSNTSREIEKNSPLYNMVSQKPEFLHKSGNSGKKILLLFHWTCFPSVGDSKGFLPLGQRSGISKNSV